MIELPICHIGNSLDPNWNTCVQLLGPDDELPIPWEINNLNLDLETTSGISNVASTNPHAEVMDEFSGQLHRACKICGVSVLFDNERKPYYIPVRHSFLDEDDEYQQRLFDIPNVPIEKVYNWLKKILSIAKVWSNHNIKYDVHVILNELGNIKLPKLRDTLALAKLSTLEEQLNYGLTPLMKLFEIDITPYEQKIKQFLGKKLKDYGLIPPDLMAVYAAVDVLCIQYLLRNLTISNECTRVVQMEAELLPELIRMERIGVRLDIEKCKEDWKRIIVKQRKRISAIKKITGFKYFQPEKKDSVKELFCDVLGWEMDYTAKSEENLEKGLINEDEATFSFGKDALLKHLHDKPHIARMWMNYQTDQKLLTSFTIPYIEEHVTSEELIHASLNQIVRTGRMSCTHPNMMQLSPAAKEYIIPYDEDYALVEFDFSQIEFRVIVHFIENWKAIEQFRRDPATDFHKWVAAMCEIHRKPAKTCNFLCGYGGGKEKLTTELMSLKEIRAQLTDESLIRERAYGVYNKYHAALPELKPTSYRCSAVLRSRGYVRTLLGRHRNLPKKFHFKAFNSVCQGTAADFQKWVTLRLRKFLGPDCLLHMLVHDSWVFSIKKTRIKELVPLIKQELERPIEDVNFLVPLLSDFGISHRNWKECDKDWRINSEYFSEAL